MARLRLACRVKHDPNDRILQRVRDHDAVPAEERVINRGFIFEERFEHFARMRAIPEYSHYASAKGSTLAIVSARLQ